VTVVPAGPAAMWGCSVRAGLAVTAVTPALPASPVRAAPAGPLRKAPPRSAGKDGEAVPILGY